MFVLFSPKVKILGPPMGDYCFQQQVQEDAQQNNPSLALMPQLGTSLFSSGGKYLNGTGRVPHVWYDSLSLWRRRIIHTSHPHARNLLDQPVNYEIISKTEDESEITLHKNNFCISEITTNSQHSPANGARSML